MPTLRVEDWPNESSGTHLFHTNFDMNKDGGSVTQSTPNFKKTLTDEAGKLLDLVIKIPGITGFVHECHLLVVIKAKDANWDNIVPEVRKAFKTIYEVTVEFSK